MTRDETRLIDTAVLSALFRSPRTTAELTVELHRAGSIPGWYDETNVRARCRRLHDAGHVTRLAHPSATRSVLWWSA